MKPNTALCFVLVGLSLWLMQPSSSELSNPRLRHAYVARVLSGAVGLIGLLTLAEYFFDVHLGIDEFLFHEALMSTGVLHPGRMAGATALGFVLLGGSLASTANRTSYFAQGLALLASLNGFVACVCYLLGAHSLYDIPAYSSMALHTAVLFLLTGLGVLASRPELGLMAAITNEHIGGVMARRNLPFVAAVPIVFGWLRWRGQLAGFYGSEFGIALRTVAEVVIFALLLWVNATWLNRIDEQRREGAHRDSHLTTLLESSDDAILSIDLTGTITGWSPGAERLFGYVGVEIIGKPVTTLTPPELQEDARQFLKESLKGRIVNCDDTVRRRKDGSLVHVTLIIAPLRDAEGQIVGVSGIVHDITGRKRNEMALRASQVRLSEIVNSAMDSIITVDRDQHIVLFNPAAEKVFGFSAQEMVGQPLERLVPERFRKAHAQHVNTFSQTGATRRHLGELGNLSGLRANGQEFPIEASISGTSSSGEQYLTVILRDITERRQAEEALRRSEEEFRTMANAIPQLAWMANPDGWIFWYNQGWYNYTGTTPQEMEGWGWQSVHDPAHLPRVMERWQASVATGQPFDMVFPLRSAHGEFRAFLTRGSPVKDPSGRVLRWFGTNTDVEESKRTEEALRLSEERLRQAQLSAGMGVFDVGLQSGNLTWSARMFEIFGLPADSPQPRLEDVAGYTHPEDRALVREQMTLMLGGESIRFDHRIIRLDGQVRWLEISGKGMADATGQLVRCLGVCRDITDRKSGEEALRRSEENFRLLFEQAPDGIFLVDGEGHFLDANPAGIQMLGYSPDELRRLGIADIVFPEEVVRIAPQIQALAGGSILTSEWKFRRKDGSPSTGEIVGRLLPNGRVVAILRNIDDRKRAEEELAQSRQALEDKSLMLESVLNSMSEGLVATDEDGHFVLWNSAAERIVGLGPTTRGPQEWTDHYGVFQSDRVTPLLLEHNPLARALRGEASTSVIFVRNPEVPAGVFVEAYGNPLKDKHGALRGGVAAFRDITERMRSEERLREYERVVEGLEEMIVVVDRDYRYIIANRTFLQSRNMKREQVVGRRVDEIIDKKTFEALVKERMDECFRGRVVEYELKYTFPKIGERDVFASYFPIEGPTGIERIACVLQDITERKWAAEARRQAEQKYRLIFEDAVVGIFQSDLYGHYLNVNPAMARLLGYGSPQELVASIADISQQVYADPESRETFRLLIEAQGIVQNFDCQVLRKDGSKIWISVTARPVFKDGVLVGYEGTNVDITERKVLEQQLLQAQKMEAVGRLAGGIAHDFNNMLGVIMGYSDLSLEVVAPDSPSHRHLTQIKKASQRAALLTRQLLAFSRQQVVFPTVLDLNEVVRNVTSMLLRVVGEDVAISFRPTTPIGCIKADRGQIEQILMNLVINARDAMPSGGEIVIGTGHAELGDHFALEHRGSGAGPHVFLTVSDTGCGMDESVQSRIFEPFFTTKEVGVGTGLGLSTVYGIVKQSGGYIVVDSTLGKGTTFDIYLPRVADKAEPLLASPEETVVPGGSETMLVVEDDASLRELTVNLLTDAGYRVLEAKDAETALEILQLRVPIIDLLLTDIVMPGINGSQLLERAKAIHPNLRALFMSGYAGSVRNEVVAQAAFLEKPFTRRSLLMKIRSVLQGESAKGQTH